MVLERPLLSAAVVQAARQHLFRGALDPAQVTALAAALHNPLIQTALALDRSQWSRGLRPPSLYPHTIPPSPATVERFAVAAMRDDELLALSRARLLALSLEEMRAVRDHFAGAAAERTAAGLPCEATDVELEMIAQTWSEHCKHKIFAAEITYREGGREERIDSLFRTYIRSTTERIAAERPFLRSVFHDNSGVIQVDEDTLLAFKVETHNSPSALDPYGGAITGHRRRQQGHPGHGQARSADLQHERPVLCRPFHTAVAKCPPGCCLRRGSWRACTTASSTAATSRGYRSSRAPFSLTRATSESLWSSAARAGILPAELNGRPGVGQVSEPGRPRRDGRGAHREGRHPRRDLFVTGAGRGIPDVGGSDRRPDHPEAHDRSADGGARSRALRRPHGQRRRRPLVVPRRDGARARGRPDPSRQVPAQVRRSRPVGDPAVGVSGAHEPRGCADEDRGAPRPGKAPGRGGVGHRRVHRLGLRRGPLRGPPGGAHRLRLSRRRRAPDATSTPSGTPRRARRRFAPGAAFPRTCWPCWPTPISPARKSWCASTTTRSRGAR